MGTDSMTREELIQARETARTGEEIIRAVARIEHANAHDGTACPPDRIPTEAVLAAWLPDCPDEAKREAARLARDLFEDVSLSNLIRVATAVHRSAANADGIDPEPITDNESLERLPGLIEGHQTVAVHAAWLASEATRPRHPLSPIVRAWQERPDNLEDATVTATVGVSPMVKRPALISDLARTAWDDVGTVEASVVDGEALAARIPDAAAVFKHRPPTKMLKPKPGEQMRIEWPRGLKPRIRPDMRLTALEGMPPILAGDLSMIVTMAYALNRPICLTEIEGAALLARTRTGEFRRPQESDQARFRRAWAAGRAALIYDPEDPTPWADAFELLDAQRTESGLYVIGPPLWVRQLASKGERWTLTGEGSAASARRSLAGKQSLAGRIVTGLEYRLGARWDGKKGIAPDLRPDNGKTGPGPVVFVGWREVLNLVGNWWDPNDPTADDAALKRFDRAVETLKGYFVSPAPRGHEAAAGDTVEIVVRVRGSRARRAGLKVRASARFVEAARLAHQKEGRGFGPVALTDYTGKPKKWDQGLRVGRRARRE